jgi:hypothetical protein
MALQRTSMARVQHWPQSQLQQRRQQREISSAGAAAATQAWPILCIRIGLNVTRVLTTSCETLNTGVTRLNKNKQNDQFIPGT